MQQLHQNLKLEFAGSPEEQELAGQIFGLMRAQGVTMAVRSAIRQSLENLAQYFAEQKYKGLETPEAIAPLIDAALTANPAIFLREESDDGEVVFKTTKVGIAPPSKIVYDYHSFKTRLFEGAQPVLPSEEEKVVKPEEPAPRVDFALPLPFAASEAKQATQQPVTTPVQPAAKAPVVEPKPAPVAEPAPVQPVAKAPAVEPKPAPVAEPAPVQPAAKAPVVEPKPTPVDQPVPEVEPATVIEPAAKAPVVEPKPASAVVAIIEIGDGLEIDLGRSVGEIQNEYGAVLSATLLKALSDDIRFVNFANDWFLEDNVDRLSKGDFRRIRDYMNEVGGPVTDTAIMSDVYNMRTSDHDYDSKRFALNFRLAREKKDFEFVGAEDSRFWTAPGLPAIGQGKRKASEIGLDYKYLEDAHLNDPVVVESVKGRKQWEHTITFYEYENGLLPYDLNAKEMFPGLMLEDQKALVLLMDAPQLQFTYTTEIRYPTGARGGWIAGLEDFFERNLIPGAKLLITQGERSNQFTIEYEEGDEQERRLLFYDERRQKFVYRTIGFECRVDENEILTPERFGKLDNQKRLDETDRKKTDFLVATAFELVGTKQGDQLYATLDDLYPLVNIERPFSRAYLRTLLTSGNSAFRPDPKNPAGFTYKIGAVKK